MGVWARPPLLDWISKLGPRRRDLRELPVDGEVRPGVGDQPPGLTRVALHVHTELARLPAQSCRDGVSTRQSGLTLTWVAQDGPATGHSCCGLRAKPVASLLQRPRSLR
uniref:Uncharacterized protein n=1 Tax=Streptomyces kanamyceticus TaxID=1967 RepID=Q1EQR1_STRKN|nr:hypothetical protein [Streptomyces kanamyceticus]